MHITNMWLTDVCNVIYVSYIYYIYIRLCHIHVIYINIYGVVIYMLHIYACIYIWLCHIYVTFIYIYGKCMYIHMARAIYMYVNIWQISTTTTLNENKIACVVSSCICDILCVIAYVISH